MSTETMTLAFGCNRGLPDGVRCAWGARLIWPDQLLHDRQDLINRGTVMDKIDLVWWLNGPENTMGAIATALSYARSEAVQRELGGPAGEEIVAIYEDHRGKIVGSAQGSHGYLYVAGWLHEHVPTR